MFLWYNKNMKLEGIWVSIIFCVQEQMSGTKASWILWYCVLIWQWKGSKNRVAVKNAEQGYDESSCLWDNGTSSNWWCWFLGDSLDTTYSFEVYNLSHLLAVECLTDHFSLPPFLKTSHFIQDTRLRVDVARIREMLNLKKVEVKCVCNEVALADPLTPTKLLEALPQTKLSIICRFSINIVNSVQTGKLAFVYLLSGLDWSHLYVLEFGYLLFVICLR